MKCKFLFKEHRNGWAAYYSPQGEEMGELYAWCRENFGSGLGEWSSDLQNTKSRWSYAGGWIWIRSEEDVMMFRLRWAGI